MKQQTTSGTPLIPPLPQLSTPGSIDTPTMEVLASWRVQDATVDPEKPRAAGHEFADVKKTLNDNRTQAGEPRLDS